MGRWPAAATITTPQIEAVARVAALERQVWRDATLATARTQGGLSIGTIALANDSVTSAKIAAGAVTNSEVNDVSAAKINAGDLATARMQTNVVAAVNGAGTGVAAGVITTGDLATARMQTNVGAAINAAGTTLTPPIDSTGVVRGTVMRADADSGGAASTVTYGNGENVTGFAPSTGAGSIKFSDATARDNIGFLKAYAGTTAVYIPVFAAP